MHMTRRELLKSGAALGVTAALGQALPQPAQAQTTQKKELVTAQGGDIAKFDPHFSTSSNDIRVSFNLFDNLTSRHPDGKLHPGLATEWKLQGQTTWAFKLRQGVKFHNGDPFTSADAKFSIERTYDPAVKTMVATALSTIDRIEAPDPYSLIIHCKKPDPLLPARLAFYGGQIVPKKYLESVGNDTFNAKPVGTGPVRFASWVKDDRAVFDANPDYWGGRIDVDRWIMRAIPETTPRVAALLKGEVDIITQLPPDQSERITANASTRVTGALYAGLYVLGVNSKRPPLDNPLVKQALSLATDREAIVKELWRGRGIVPSGPIAKGDNHFDPSLPPLAYNPKEARERLKKAGYKGEEIFIETTVAYVSQDKAMSEAMAAMWKDVGVNVKVEVIEYSVRAQKSREKSFKGAVVVRSDVDARRSRRDDVAPARARRPDGLLARRQVRRAGQCRALLGGREVPRRGLPGHHQDLPREPAVDPGDPAVRGLRDAEVRGVDAEPEPAIRDPPLQPEVPPSVSVALRHLAGAVRLSPRGARARATSHRVRDPAPVKAERHALRQGDRGHRLPGKISGIEDRQVAAVLRRVVDVRHHPALVLSGVWSGRDEHGLGRHPARAEVVCDRRAVSQVVLDQRRAGVRIRPVIRMHGVAVAIG